MIQIKRKPSFKKYQERKLGWNLSRQGHKEAYRKCELVVEKERTGKHLSQSGSENEVFFFEYIKIKTENISHTHTHPDDYVLFRKIMIKMFDIKCSLDRL